MSVKKKIKAFLENSDVFYKAYNMLSHNHIQINDGSILSCCRGLLNRCDIIVNGNKNKILIREGSQLSHVKIHIRGNNNQVLIGSNVSILNGGFYIEDDGNTICLGDNTTTSGLVNFSCAEGTNIMVGEDCMFSANIDVRTSDAHSIIDKVGKRTNPSKDINIGAHSWIGNTVIILKGTQIGKNCIVGAGSVLTRESKFEEQGIAVAGNPAKIVKRGVNWKRERV